MARTKEFMRRSEARIIVFLELAAKNIRDGHNISILLQIDYIYVMKVLSQMYEKGWLKTHKYERNTYFRLTLRTPIKEAKQKLLKGNEQTQLKRDDE